MDELRWALLGLGLLFVAGLAWWEMRKPRQAARADEASREGFTSEPPAAPAPQAWTPPRRIEPRFGDEPGSAHEFGAQDEPTPAPGSDPPVFLMDVTPLDPTAEGISIVADVAVDSPERRPPEAIAADDDEPWIGEETLASATSHRREPSFEPDAGLTAGAQDEAPAAAAARREPEPPPAQRAAPAPEWPPEDQRRIVSLRVAPRPPNRFGGRTLRLAFQACGLEYGALDIFHLADEHGRVFASAANLMRPGTFRLETMDSQFFHGVHLFSVLPGPLPAGRAVDELVALARDIAQRVQGMVLDPVGQPLDEERVAALRASAESGNGGEGAAG